MHEYETRTFRLREIRADGESGQIVGYAAVYNAPSEDLGGFIEVIEPGFFERVLDGDTRALFNHDANYVLGRSTAGTLRLLDDDAGLGFQVDAPQTQAIRDLVLAPMQRGDIDQCSFAFSVLAGGDEWAQLDNGNYQRTLKRGGCAALYDISVVTFPAYPQTSAQARDRLAGMRAQAQAGSENSEAAEAEARVGNARLQRQKLVVLKMR